MTGEQTAGIQATISNTVIIPCACAQKPAIDINIATMPQENPFIIPAIILLYSGITPCAVTIIIGVAIIVKSPINPNIIMDNIGCAEYVIINNIISGNVEIIEKYSTNL